MNDHHLNSNNNNNNNNNNNRVENLRTNETWFDYKLTLRSRAPTSQGLQ
jgi:hypothetical protein